MGRNQRMGYFPAFGVNWNIQDEPFLAAAKEKWLDMAKIRLSYGESGTPPKGTPFIWEHLNQLEIII